MARRSDEWNETLAGKLQNKKFAAKFVLKSVAGGSSVQEALGKFIRCYGIKEFARLANIASPNIVRVLDLSYNPTQSTLNRLLLPLGLRISLAHVTRNNQRRRLK